MLGPITRRDCTRALIAAAVPVRAKSDELTLQNAELCFRTRTPAGRELTNLLTNATVALPSDHFELEFEGGVRVGAGSTKLQAARGTGDGMELLYSAESPAVEVRVRYSLGRRTAYLRKRIAVRSLVADENLRLMRADLENWRGVRREWRSMNADATPYGSHPIFCEDLWAGVEFVAAFNRYDRDGFVLRSLPGGLRIGGGWTDLRSTVVGVAEPGGVRESFLRYIEDIRLAPPRWVACYNSWWTLPLLVKQEDYLALMRRLKEELFDRHGVFFDIVATDAGWNDPQSIWQIDRRNLPHGFDDMRAIVEAAGGRAGLWMSPGEEYPPNFDYEWGRANGYTVLTNTEPDRPGAWNKGVSIADPRYLEEAKAQLRKLIRENRFAHIKYDGLVAREAAAHHDLRGGDDSVEPIAEHSLELLRVAKEADPQLVTEPTYLNSFANYISPWIIKYSDTVWANAGGDCPLAFTPAPDYREAHTTAREYFIFSSLNEVWLPQNALQYFDIVHCDDEPGFANHAAMAVGRGRFFLSTYLNPRFMTEDDWRICAGLLKWARANQDILRNTKVVTSRVEIGEPYAYGHWLGRRGIVAVRNPSNETRKYTLDLRAAGAPASLADAVCYTQYPYRKGIAAGLTGGSKCDLLLGPWELVFLEIVPRSELKEAIVMGARWYREHGSLRVAPSRDAERAVLLAPGEKELKIPAPVRSADALTGELTALAIRHVPGTPSVGFEMECAIHVPAEAKGSVLFLVEFPGRKHMASRAEVSIDGSAVKTREKTSANHVGYYMPTEGSYWKDAMPYEAEWTWYIADLPAGDSKARISGRADHPRARVGAWAWCERDLKASAVAVPGTATEPAMPQYRDHLEREGICLRSPRA